MTVLRWKRAIDSFEEPGTWAYVLKAPQVNSGFSENGTFLFDCQRPDVTLYIDDEPLMPVGSDTCIKTWHVGFFAGEVTGELVDGEDRVLQRFLLDVSPDCSKLGRDVFLGMVQEILAYQPELIVGSEPGTSSAGSDAYVSDPWPAFSRLRRYGPGFLEALRNIGYSPRRTSRAFRDNLPLRLVRRIDQRTARMCTASLLAASANAELASLSENADTGLNRWDVPVVHKTLDSAANRAIVHLLRSMLLRVDKLIDALSAAARAEAASETRTPLALRLPRRLFFLTQLRAKLKLELRQSPWKEVSRAEVSSGGLLAVQTDPSYARAWGLGLRALRPGVEGVPDAERMWLTPSWEVYEKWCFVRLATQLRSSLPNLDWRRSSRSWIAHGDGFRLGIELQPTFLAGPGTCRWSVSKQREPDLILWVEQGSELKFMLLDAKYRTSRAAVLDAMSSAHIYRDSLRIGDRRPEAALILIPCGGGVPWLEDHTFHNSERVGAQPFFPDADGAAAVIARFLPIPGMPAS